MSKKILICALVAGLTTAGMCALANAEANASGIYLGAQAGVADTHFTKSSLGITSGSIHDTGLAGGVFTGYQFNQNWAAELGFTQFSNTKINNIDGTGVDGKVRENAVDLVAKGILPLQDNFSLIGKLGAAFVTAMPSASGYGVTANGGTTHKVYPTGTIGVSYNITPNVPVDLTYTRIQRVGNSNSIESIDYAALGVSYRFDM